MSDYLSASTGSVDARLYNNNMLNQLKHGMGPEKMAGLFNQDIIMKVLHEDGLARRLFSTKPITPDQLDFDPANPDVPTKFEPIEDPLNSYLVNSTDYMQPTEDLWFKSKYFKVTFLPMISRKLKMTETQIMAAKYPIRQYIEAQIKNDFLAAEDFMMIDRFERCIKATTMQTSYTGTASGLFEKEHIMKLLKMFPRQKLAADRLIIHENTFYDIIGWNHSQVGSVIMADIIEKGPMGETFKFKSYFGLKWLITNNIDIVPEKTIYAVVPQKMLGPSYELMAPETFVKFEDGIFSCHSRQVVGRAIANPYGVAKMLIT
jgi:hypothetical protein